MLPQKFTERMQEMLQEEYPLFLASYGRKCRQSLRFNPLKGSREEFLQRAPFSLEPVAWEENGFYYDSPDQPGKHPYHEAGVYYIQEASAMAPASFLQAAPGERVLDLCAAPGGKSGQLAAAMAGEGLLVSNEIHPARAKILSENMERLGVRNVLVTNETPRRLAERFPEYFDRILVDAPCSGEGMFRKNGDACAEWSLENVKLCAARQDEILGWAAGMLRAGGRLVYSTCTFAPEENEGTAARFLRDHPEFSLVEAARKGGMEGGRPAWSEAAQGMAQGMAQGLEKTVRLWPHQLEGEGHFAALFQKEGRVPEGYTANSRYGEEKGIFVKDCPALAAFWEETAAVRLPGILLRFGEQIYLAPEGTPSLRGLKVLRPGLHLGTVKKGRFEPAHALALALSANQVRRSRNLPAGRDACAYLSGLSLPAEGEKGWYLMTVDGYSMGWGKLAGGMLKNHYPKGLRKNWL